MVTERLEIRIDPERRRKLSMIAAEQGVPVSEIVRKLIDQACEDFDRTWRLRAVQRIAAAEVDDMPDPDTLKRQLESAYDIPDLH